MCFYDRYQTCLSDFFHIICQVFIRFASKQTEMTEAEMVQDAEECMASELKV